MNPRHAAAALAPVVLAALTGVATAQISIPQPAPQQRVAPAIPKFTVDQQGNLVAPDDKPTAAPNPSGQSSLEIRQVPKVFEGCWEGTVPEPDSWQHLQGPRIAGWMPTTYRLCFRRTGDGPFSGYTISGEPEPNWYNGTLNAMISQGSSNQYDAVAESSLWDSWGPSSNYCGQVNCLLSAAGSWPNGMITYLLLGPNSNTFAHYLGDQGNFHSSKGPPPRTPGWNMPL